MAHKICPICHTPAHPNAAVCSACGASLQQTQPVTDRLSSSKQKPAPVYDHQYGETDLFEGNVRWRGGTYILVGMLLLAVIACMGVVFVMGVNFYSMMSGTPAATALASPGGGVDTSLATNTLRPTIVLNTVTPAPTMTETLAPTDTPGPCMQQVQQGDSLIAIVQRCGHRDLAVIDLVLEENGLDAPELIQVGQTLIIPWPTPTPNPEADSSDSTEAVEGEASSQEVAAVEINPLSGLPVPPTETLQPGVAWHTVAQGETIISVAYQYGANVKILSELNPEVTFSQCDFGLEAGGAQCSVSLIEGQRIRVPSPTATPTLSPTPSGSETPTPSPTPTFNAPNAMSPSDRMLFQRDEFVTLRWVASGSLASGQVYRVEAEDITTGDTYQADTTELFLVLPKEWQGTDGTRHEYRWRVSVIDVDRPGQPYFTTEPLSFYWEALAEASE
ncbi:MAG: LysM peptidoglycan-binding domain-containing protein [Anaerolineae bacterium]|nr:LysM peptidoglycan-binding domain-containing protein [Anaerolineae bacterium]